MPALPFPRSSSPGARTAETEGRLINAMTTFNGDTPFYTRVAGCTALGSGTGIASPRGLFVYDTPGGTALLAGYSGVIRQFASNGTITTFSGTLTGTDRLTFAQNSKIPAADVAIARQSGGAYQISVGTAAVSAWADSDLPATVNSVAVLSSFFLFTDPTTGKIWSGDVNAVSVNALSFASAEARPDNLTRGLASGNTFLAFGTDSIEPWLMAGKSPFPMIRQQTIIGVGLLEFGAVAGGGQAGWNREVLFVAGDGTVRLLNGYTPQVVSTPAVERFIASSTAGTFDACVYVANGQPIWSLTTDQGTWEFNLTTQAWHERVSAGLSTWRAIHTAKLQGSWFALDRSSDRLLKIDPSVQTEGSGSALIATIESGDLKEFPSWLAIPALFLDVTRGAGSMDVSWSVDGGANWSTPETISLTDVQGPVRLNRLGMSGPDGLRVRITKSDSNAFSFLGAQVPDAAARKG